MIIGRGARRLKEIWDLQRRTIMSIHRIFCETLPADGTLQVTGPEAHHALRVKRLEKGDPVRVCDGRGRLCDATVTQSGRNRLGEWEMELAIHGIRTLAAVSPRVEVFSGVPKGPRLEDMIDQLSQVGVAAWRPVLCERTVVEPRQGKLDRLHRVAVEAAKQCGRAWIMEIDEAVPWNEAIRREEALRVIVADSSGEALRPGAPSGFIRLLVGPEGGLTSDELARARSAGAEIASFGAHTMRIETAAAVAAGILLAAAGGRPENNA